MVLGKDMPGPVMQFSKGTFGTAQRFGGKEKKGKMGGEVPI